MGDSPSLSLFALASCGSISSVSLGSKPLSSSSLLTSLALFLAPPDLLALLGVFSVSLAGVLGVVSFNFVAVFGVLAG